MSRRTGTVRWSVEARGWAWWWVPHLRAWLTLEEARATGRSFSSAAHALTRRKTEKLAARMPDPARAVLTMRCSRHSRKFPLGFERSYGEML